MTLSLSTMWAQQPRFVDDMHRFVEEARAAGYDAIEVSHSTPEAQFQRLVSHHDVAISSIHAPAPLRIDGDNRRNSSLNLASTDEREREAAVADTMGSIELAARHGAKFVVVHLGGVGGKMFDAELKLRRLYDAGTRDGGEVAALREECLRLRRDQVGPWLEMAAHTLEQLARCAEDNAVALGIENRLHHHEIPLPHEAEELLEDYPPDLVGYLHDVGHAEVQWRLGLVDKRVWLDTNGPRTIGTHLHDVDGIGDHRAPGRGDVEWDYIAAGLPASALRVFEINQTQPPESLPAAITFLRSRGVVL